MVSRSGPPEAMLCPALICDACREQILTDKAGGNALHWVRFDPAESSPLLLAHGGPCSSMLRTALSGHYRTEDGWSAGWEEIGTVLDQLANNAVRAFADDPNGSHRATRVVPPPAELLARVNVAVRIRLGLPPAGQCR